MIKWLLIRHSFNSYLQNYNWMTCGRVDVIGNFSFKFKLRLTYYVSFNLSTFILGYYVMMVGGSNGLVFKYKYI